MWSICGNLCTYCKFDVRCYCCTLLVMRHFKGYFAFWKWIIFQLLVITFCLNLALCCTVNLIVLSRLLLFKQTAILFDLVCSCKAHYTFISISKNACIFRSTSSHNIHLDYRRDGKLYFA